VNLEDMLCQIQPDNRSLSMVGPRDRPPVARAGRWLAKFQRRSGVSLIGQLNCLIPDNSPLFRLENSLFNSLGNWPPRRAESLAFWGREQDHPLHGAPQAETERGSRAVYVTPLVGSRDKRQAPPRPR
jgi:hypothetical protein